MKLVKFIDLPLGARFRYQDDKDEMFIVLGKHGRGEVCADPETTKDYGRCCACEEDQELKDLIVEVYFDYKTVARHQNAR